ncbi:cytochrome P450 2K16 [Sinocyclocheilus rhinocerous]|uniref:cytochrome P450 2K16 n=1 Tax=Sinocyclocheilus rhinocerous TaxID=307959 RepID=UPI0007B949FF|nr:PREDICTED: cytochrome P450 2K1-like [Sinocyclocheilus rhinocerous]
MALMEALLQVSSTGTLICCLLLLLAVCLLFFRSQRDENEPPGPKPLPLLGNLLMLDVSKPHLSLCEMAKQFGPVFTVYFGPKKVVVLAGYKTVKQALVNHADEFGDREITPLFHDLTKGHGIIFANGESWREMRRFALTNLRDFGMGKKKIEEKIIEETCHLLEEFEKFEGKPFETTRLMNYAASSVISSIVYGRSFKYTDPQLRCMVDRANESVRLSGTASVQLYNMFPFLSPWLKNLKLIMNNLALDIKEISELVSSLHQTLNSQDLRGFVDSFLIRMQNAEESGVKNSLFQKQNLIFTVANLFVAGTDTTSTTLRWGLLFMAKYPHIQDRLQEEIDQVIGGRQPVSEDRKNLPYTDAVIHETQRFANIAPMSIPHMTSCDVHFNGYFIKKGTCVFPLLMSVLWDEDEWETPRNFNPEHFLDKQGRFVKRDTFLPFSAGHRVCLGEGLARMELFLFFTSLFQRFRFTPPPGVSENDLDLTPAVGFTLNPTPHKLCAVKHL